MTGTGSADMHGAISVINATATGHGAALAIQGGVQATWTITDRPDLDWQTPGMDDRLVRAVHALLTERYGLPSGAAVRTDSPFPPARGLKTSSGAAAALLLAGVQAGDISLRRDELIERSVQAAVAAGVTLTGALDDQVAVVCGGCHLTDNPTGRTLESLAVEKWAVAVWVPQHAIAKQDVARVDATAIARQITQAEHVLLDGDLPGALTLNGQAFTDLYVRAGLPVTTAPAHLAMDHGALGAGLSGTGPAVAALFDAPVDLPAVPGGSWVWTEAVP